MKIAFELQGIVLSLDKIRPLKTVKGSIKKTVRYQRIVASVAQVGIVEPLVVYPDSGKDAAKGAYLLLDGHLRLEVLKERGDREARCLIATDDESYTYNRHVSRLSTIQEHFMIMKALKEGVDEVRLAQTLDIDLAKLREKKNVIRGVCAEAVELLKDKPIVAAGLRMFRRVKPMRQIEMAELLAAASNYSTPFINALVVATPDEEILEPDKSKQGSEIRPADIARMEREMSSLERDRRSVEDSYSHNVFQLVLVQGYLRKLLNKGAVVRFLATRHRDILEELQKIIEATELSG